MARSLHVRNVDDELVLRLKRRAAENGRSAEAEHREILRTALTGTIVGPSEFQRLAADVRKLTADRRQMPAELLIREGRDER